MAKRLKPLAVLKDDQLRASSPADHAALSASAGTGKTHVLTARVLRLLLAGVDPSSILCLTFTKAGAAEMADRIHARLAYWVRLKEPDLRKELFALGEVNDEDALVTARTLFARVLDASGGGLRIQTIHAFAQSLLAAFPAEAGLASGFRPLEGREEQVLARAALAELLVRAEREGDLGLVADMQRLSHRMGEGGAEGFLMQSARAPAAMVEIGPREGIEARLRRAFDLPLGDIEDAIGNACGDDVFDIETLRRIAAANQAWGSATGLKCCDAIAKWQARGNTERGASLAEIADTVTTKAGEPRAIGAGLLKADPDYAEHAVKLIECCQHLLGMRSTAELVKILAAGLRAGQAFALAYGEAKRAAGVVDFDDLIRWAEELLLTPGMGDWVRYKLDQATDHILVDEAQDTNERQWNIIRALTEEFLAGEGAVGRHRTIFTVGDFKQAIFSFQGTDPREFDKARAYFQSSALELRKAAAEIGVSAENIPPDFLDLSMDRSFRSSPPVLSLVDHVISSLGHEALGLPRCPNLHVSHHEKRPGSVTLWRPLSSEIVQSEDDTGEEGWVGDTTRVYASRIARQIKAWLDHPFEVKGRPLKPEDILILVRRRGDLASLIVARLYAENVPVAGVDRLLLNAPLAVQDLLAAARFAMQPLDDLNLASLLVSPLLGWSQDDLFAAAFGREGALWASIRATSADIRQLAGTREALLSILAMADYATPHQFFETLLSGTLEGRRKLLLRLSQEARDPIEELLASALEFEASTAPSLQRFLDWFSRGDVEIVRDPSEPLDAVRLMTVHGSKGLQSPIVILADACVDPNRARGSYVNFQLPGEGPCLPIFRPRKDELAEPLKSQIEARDALDREEHWRLLYVALTRAEERLYIGGALGPADKNGPPAASWYAAVDSAMAALGGEWQEDHLWGQARVFGNPQSVGASIAARPVEMPSNLPDWLHEAAPFEARPPRPLAPSSTGEDDVADPPPSPAMRDAARRGRLLHQLFERLPGVAPELRAEVADQWLERAAGVSDAAERERLVNDASRIIADPAHAELFSASALAEAPIAVVIADGLVVSGTVDRLLVSPDRILIIDFKTGRKAPANVAEIPLPHLRQMAAYTAALRVIFPDRPVESALLYTAGPILHSLPGTLLAAHAPQAAVAAPAGA